MHTNQANAENLSAAELFRRSYTGTMSQEEWTARQKANERHVWESMRINRIKAMAHDLGPRYSRELCDLAAYRVYDPRQQVAVDRIRALGRDLKAFIASGKNLVLFGTVGTGKDHLLAWLLYQAADMGTPCRYANGQELFSRFRGTMDDRAHEREIDVLEDFAKPPVIGISDPLPPSGANSDWRREIFYRLIDKRYRAMRGTWITANTTIGAADAAFTEPVWDRIQEGAEVIVCDWQSFRERKTK
jgi:DNA replication protein DnaC